MTRGKIEKKYLLQNVSILLKILYWFLCKKRFSFRPLYLNVTVTVTGMVQERNNYCIIVMQIFNVKVRNYVIIVDFVSENILSFFCCCKAIFQNL